MKTCLIAICFAVFIGVQTVVADADNPLPKHRSRRFIDIGELLKGLKSGAKFINTVNEIFNIEKTDFGRVIAGIANFDAPTSETVYSEFDTMMKSRKDMTKEQTTRAQQMMAALKENMDGNSGSMLTATWVSVSSLTLSALCAVW